MLLRGVDTPIYTISFSGSNSYVIECFFNVYGYKNRRFFQGCKNIYLNRLISAVVICKDYHSQRD